MRKSIIVILVLLLASSSQFLMADTDIALDKAQTMINGMTSPVLSGDDGTSWFTYNEEGNKDIIVFTKDIPTGMQPLQLGYRYFSRDGVMYGTIFLYRVVNPKLFMETIEVSILDTDMEPLFTGNHSEFNAVTIMVLGHDTEKPFMLLNEQPYEVFSRGKK